MNIRGVNLFALLVCGLLGKELVDGDAKALNDLHQSGNGGLGAFPVVGLPGKDRGRGRRQAPEDAGQSSPEDAGQVNPEEEQAASEHTGQATSEDTGQAASEDTGQAATEDAGQAPPGEGASASTDTLTEAPETTESDVQTPRLNIKPDDTWNLSELPETEDEEEESSPSPNPSSPSAATTKNKQLLAQPLVHAGASIVEVNLFLIGVLMYACVLISA